MRTSNEIKLLIPVKTSQQESEQFIEEIQMVKKHKKYAISQKNQTFTPFYPHKVTKFSKIICNAGEGKLKFIFSLLL